MQSDHIFRRLCAELSWRFQQRERYLRDTQPLPDFVRAKFLFEHSLLDLALTAPG